MNILMRCFRRAPRKAAASGAAAPAAYVAPKVIVGWTEALLVKTAMAAGGLVCVGVLVWLPIYASAWSDWRSPRHEEALVEPRPFGWTEMDAPGGLARRTVSALRSSILDAPPPLFPVTAEASPRPGAAPSPFASLLPSQETSPGRSSIGPSQPQPVPEPGSLAVFLAGVVGLALLRRART